MFKTIYNFFHRHYHKRYHGQYHQAKKLFAVDLFLLATAIILLASSIFFFFWKPGITDKIDLNISLGNARFQSGEKIKITVDYKNRSENFIHNTILGLHLPDGFVIDKELSPNTFNDNSTFDIKDVAPGGSGQVYVYGQLWVEPKTDNHITALFSYLPENKTYREQKNSSFLLNLPDSVLKSYLEINNPVFAKQRLPFVFKLVNSGDFEVKNINLDLNFIGTISNVETAGLKNIALKKNEEKIITGEIITPTKSGKYDFTISVITILNNKPIKILKEIKTIEVLSPDIHSQVTLLNPPNFAEPKQTLQARINWQNNGPQELINSNLRLSFTKGIVDLKATAKENNFKIDGEDLLITATQRTALSDGQIGARDQFNFSIILLPSFVQNNTENTTLEIKPIFSAEIKNLPGQKFYLNGESTNIKLASELILSAQARYYSNEGDQLGRGPLPPQVGEITKYWIFVNIDNTFNPMNNAIFTATLPNNISFTGKQSVTIGPSLNYNEQNHTINWQYRELPANSRTGLYFEVATTPSPDQINKTITLLNNIKFTATDKVTGRIFSLSNSAITNLLPSLDIGSKKSNLVQ